MTFFNLQHLSLILTHSYSLAHLVLLMSEFVCEDGSLEKTQIPSLAALGGAVSFTSPPGVGGPNVMCFLQMLAFEFALRSWSSVLALWWALWLHIFHCHLWGWIVWREAPGTNSGLLCSVLQGETFSPDVERSWCRMQDGAESMWDG